MYYEMTPNGVRFLVSLIVLLVIYLVTELSIRIVNAKVADLKKRHNARKVVLYLLTVIAMAVIGAIWVPNIKMLSVVISVIGAGLAVSVGEAILSMAGWFLILTRRPYDIGDRIQIGEVKGDVIDVRLFQTTLLEIGNWVKDDQSTGRVVHIPNAAVFRNPVFNFTKGFEFLWDEIKIILTFGSNWKKAEDIMLRHAKQDVEAVAEEVARRIKKMSEVYYIYYDKLTPIVYTNILDNGVELSLRYLAEVKKRRQCHDRLSRLILDDFMKERDIAFACRGHGTTG